MPYKTQHFISPSYTHRKLEPPFFKDVVDVFEDRMLNWLLVPAKELLKIRHGEIAAVALTTTYLEAIEIYQSGVDSKGRSREFFKRGFKSVFTELTGPDFMHEAITSSLYELLRCGFAHEGMFRHGIYFSTVRPEALYITWPKKYGEFDPKGELESAILNPHRYVYAIETHFRGYMRQLRSLTDSSVKDRFKAAIALKWHLNERDRSIGVTEEQFYQTK